MNRIVRLTALAVACFTVSAVAARAETGAPGTQGGLYLATLVDTGHVLPRAESVPLRIRLDRLTSDDEADALAKVSASGRELSLRQAFFGRYLGRLEINGRLGDPIVYARRFEDERGSHLVVIAQRFIGLRERFANVRSTDYPFTVIELDFRADGRADGEMSLAARLRPEGGGRIGYQSLGFVPGRLLAVKRLG
jgi:hypothetical protein